MNEIRRYSVSNHLFEITTPTELLSEEELRPYAPFRTDICLENHNNLKSLNGIEDELLFSLSLVKSPDKFLILNQKILSFNDENGTMILYTMPKGDLGVNLISPIGTECGNLCLYDGFSKAIAWIGGTAYERRYALDTILMLTYAFASSKYSTILIHASVVEYMGKGYIFLGKSGTGKSTHSRLWIDNFPEAELLNDDNPVIRIIKDKAFVFGSPWSGKSPCHKNHKVLIGAIVRLHQACHNYITPLSKIKAYAALLPSCSCMKWNHKMAETLHDTLSQLIANVRVYSMDCLPDKDAASLCAERVLR